MLAIVVAVRIIANQITVTQATESVRRALGQKEAALADTDAALDRVREANETLKRSEEHLRLVFDTAVDGIVELDENDVVVRANEAFCQMVHLDRDTVEGQRWTALAASLDGADGRFADLPAAGQAQLGARRRDAALPRVPRLRDPHPTAAPPRADPGRDAGQGGGPDDPLAAEVPPGEGRGPDEPAATHELGDRGERNRVARDLHDGPVQGVSAASLSLEAALLMIGPVTSTAASTSSRRCGRSWPTRRTPSAR